jgi:hypothetical protein
MTKLSPRLEAMIGDDPANDGWPDVVTRARGSLCEGVKLDDFVAYMPQHAYIFIPTREMWPAGSINERIPPVAVLDANGNPITKDGKKVRIAASKWLDRHKPVEQATWSPGEPMFIRDRLISDGGWFPRDGVTTFNLYRPPTIETGDAAKADLWKDHIRRVYPDEMNHIVRWLAHRVQKPNEKINHALVLGGSQGIGKDTLLEPVKHAVGPWNFTEVSPQQVTGRFNGFLKSVILRISEARDLGDVDRYAFYERMKSVIAAPPDVHRVDEKNLREHAVPNVTGVIVTTNYADGLYLPIEDRRHCVAWSQSVKEEFKANYWNDIWRWYQNGGIGHVAAYLATVDLSSFDPKAPPPKTVGWSMMVDSNRAPEDAELTDVIDNLGNPSATTLSQIIGWATGDFQTWLLDRRNSRQIPHRMGRCGYVSVRNDCAKDGLWKINGKRQVIYARSDMSIRDRTTAANQLGQCGQ